MNDETAPAPETGEADADRSLTDDLRQLVDDGRTLVEAELAYQKSRAVLAGKRVAIIAVLGALAAALVAFSLMALALGAVLALTPVLGAWGATAAVVGSLLFVSLLCVMAARLTWVSTVRILVDKDRAQ